MTLRSPRLALWQWRSLRRSHRSLTPRAMRQRAQAETLAKLTEAQRTARLVAAEEDEAARLAAAREPTAAAVAAAARPLGGLPGFLKAAYKPRKPFTVQDVDRAAALLREALCAAPQCDSASPVRACASAASEQGGPMDGGRSSGSPDTCTSPTTLGGPIVLQCPETLSSVLQITLPQSRAPATGGAGKSGVAPLLEAAFAALGYDAQTCASICASRQYPAELFAVAAALNGDPPASTTAVRSSFDAGADALLAGLSALIENQRSMLLRLNAEIAAATTASEIVAAQQAKKERRKMMLKWCTVCLRPECNFRPVIREWEE